MILKAIILTRKDLENSLMLQCVKYKILPLARQRAEVLVCLSGEQFVDSYDDDDGANYHSHYDHYGHRLVKGLKSLFASPENNLWIPMMIIMIIIMVKLIRMIGSSKG